MPILQPLRAVFDANHNGASIPNATPFDQVRSTINAMIDQGYCAFVSSHHEVARERDIFVPVIGGEITLRLYRAEAGDALLPCHVYYHGGGFFVGTLNQADSGCRALAASLGCVVISVDYRLAPECRFPTAVDDAYAALCWIADHAGDLAIDLSRLSVGGGSAGGNLAAVASLMARDRGGPPIVAQVLEIPVADFTSTATLDYPDDGIRIEAHKAYAELYLRDEADARDPRASPLLAETLAGLPPALIMCAEYDQLRPEGEAYARRLGAAGVPTTYRCWKGQFHGSQMMDKLIPTEAAAYRAEILAFLRAAYDGTAIDAST